MLLLLSGVSRLQLLLRNSRAWKVPVSPPAATAWPRQLFPRLSRLRKGLQQQGFHSGRLLTEVQIGKRKV